MNVGVHYSVFSENYMGKFICNIHDEDTVPLLNIYVRSSEFNWFKFFLVKACGYHMARADNFYQCVDWVIVI